MGIQLTPYRRTRRDLAVLPPSWDDIFQDLFSPATTEAAPVFRPRSTLTEDEDSYNLIFEIPGMCAKDVEIVAEGDTLTVRGEKKAEQISNEDQWHVNERRFGSFQRSFTFSQAILDGSVSAEVADGLLRVRVKKAEAARSRKIKIKGS